jgi:hypothetical protein
MESRNLGILMRRPFCFYSLGLERMLTMLAGIVCWKAMERILRGGKANNPASRQADCERCSRRACSPAVGIWSNALNFSAGQNAIDEAPPETQAT